MNVRSVRSRDTPLAHIAGKVAGASSVASALVGNMRPTVFRSVEANSNLTLENRMSPRPHMDTCELFREEY